MALKDIVKVAHYYDVKYGFNKEAQEKTQAQMETEKWQPLSPEDQKRWDELQEITNSRYLYSWEADEKSRLKSKEFGYYLDQKKKQNPQKVTGYGDESLWRDRLIGATGIGKSKYEEGDTLYDPDFQRYMRFDGKNWKPLPTEVDWSDFDDETKEKLTGKKPAAKSFLGKQLKQQVQQQQEQEKWDATPIEQKLEGVGYPTGKVEDPTSAFNLYYSNPDFKKQLQQKPSDSMGQSALKPVTQQIGKELAKQVGTQAKKQIDSKKINNKSSQ